VPRCSQASSNARRSSWASRPSMSTVVTGR
jgi:hypothetical protein